MAEESRKVPKMPNQIGWAQCSRSGALINTQPSQNLEKLEQQTMMKAHHAKTEKHNDDLKLLISRVEALEKQVADLRKAKKNESSK